MILVPALFTQRPLTVHQPLREDVRLGHVSAAAPALVCCPLAFYHTFANTAVVLSAAACLNTVVVPAEFFHAEDTLRAVQAER